MQRHRDRNTSPPRRFRPMVGHILAVFMPVLMAAALISEVAAAPNEYEVKAAFLYNFAKFTDWPAVQAPAEEQFTICILGDDPFGSALGPLNGKPIAGKPVDMRRLTEPRDVSGCRIVFVGRPHTENIAGLAAALQSQPVLTVGDYPGFVRSGGMIGFVLDDGRIRFEINPDRIALAGLTVSSQMLKLAIIIRDGGSR
jgi:hypothetical protein